MDDFSFKREFVQSCGSGRGEIIIKKMNLSFSKHVLPSMNVIGMMVLPALSSLVEMLLVLLLLDVIGRRIACLIVFPAETAFSKSLLNARVPSAEARFDVCDSTVQVKSNRLTWRSTDCSTCLISRPLSKICPLNVIFFRGLLSFPGSPV